MSKTYDHDFTIDSNGDLATSGGVGSGTEYVEDAAAPANPTAPAVSLIRQDTPAALTTTDGDIVTQRGTNFGAAFTQILDSAGNFVNSFGGGTQYTEDDAAPSNPVGTMLMARRRDSTSTETTTDGDVTALNCDPEGKLKVAIFSGGAVLDVNIDTLDGGAVPIGGGTEAGALRVTVANDSTGVLSIDDNGGSLTVDGTVAVTGVATETTLASILTSSQLIDDIVYTDDTSTHSTGTSKGALIMGAAVPTDTSVNANDIGAVGMTTDRRLYTEATQSGTWNVTNVSGTISLPTGASTLTEQQTQTTALQLIDDIVYTDDTSTHSTGTSKGALFMAAAAPTDASVNANDIGAVAMTTDRKLHVSVQDALPAGTNGIGKLTANSGVDIGDVDVTTCGTITPGTAATNLGKAEDAAHNTGDVGVMMLAVREATPTDLSAGASDGDYEPLQVGATGRLWTAANIDQMNGVAVTMNNGAAGTGVQRVTIASDSTGNIATIGTSVTPGTGAANLGKAEDAVAGTGDTGVFILAVANEGNATRAADGDYIGMATDTEGNTRIIGNRDHDAVDAGESIKIGGIARQANPTAVAALDRADLMMDDIGRPAIAVHQVRDLISHQHTQIASSSAETTIITATASEFHDIISLVITNQTATAVNVTIKDSTAGTTRMIVALAASGGAVICPSAPIPQIAAVNNNWTATLSSAAVTVNIFALFAKNV